MFQHLQRKFVSKDLVSAVKMLSYEYDYIYLMAMNSVTEKKLWTYFFKVMEFPLNRIKSRFKAGILFMRYPVVIVKQLALKKG